MGVANRVLPAPTGGDGDQGQRQDGGRHPGGLKAPEEAVQRFDTLDLQSIESFRGERR